MTEEKDKADVLQAREQWKQAFEAGDVDRMMSFYTNDNVSYDIMPPLQFDTEQAWRKNWEDFLGQFAGDQKLEFADDKFMCSGDLAVLHSLKRVTGTMAGHPTDLWTRQTNVSRKINGNWVFVHGHISVPVDFAANKPALDLNS